MNSSDYIFDKNEESMKSISIIAKDSYGLSKQITVTFALI